MTIALGDAEFIVAAKSVVTIPLDVVPALPFELSAHVSSGREVARYRISEAEAFLVRVGLICGVLNVVRPGPAPWSSAGSSRGHRLLMRRR
ncbi:MAG: hypothetical protein M3432_06215 [Chloroflexota bacterium]|nr:hypothetical protein [Chloroflexota bacterium]